MQEEKDKIFIAKWFSLLIAIWYISVGLSWYYPKTLEMLYWPLHTHDIKTEVIKSEIDWQSYIDKLDKDLEKGYLYVEDKEL